jgi:predicted nucleic acid-binding protein
VNRLEAGGVLDTSVAVKIARLDESLLSQAIAVTDLVWNAHGVWASPDLFDLECAAAMAKAARLEVLSAGEAREAATLLRELPLNRFETTRLVPGALDLALASAVSVYDACYVVLAELLRLPVVTADMRLVRAFDGSGHDVVYLADLDLEAA